MISVVINSDTRIGWNKPESTIGDYGESSLQGVRSSDFLIDGVKNKMDFFRGHDCQCILFIDEHEKIPDSLFMKICDLVHSYGNNSKIICKPNNRKRHRWFDYITLEALKLSEGEYVVHWDNDAVGFRTDECDIVDAYFDLLNDGYKYICQPTDLKNHGMYWASTRFFICKTETLDFKRIENSFQNPLMGKANPCLEHTLGILAGDGNVLYPPREDTGYIIFSWARYYQGTLNKLNNMPPKEAIDYVLKLGIHGVNDCLDKQVI